MNKKPVGVCNCGLCFDYEIIRKFPLKIKCEVCGKEPTKTGIIEVQKNES